MARPKKSSGAATGKGKAAGKRRSRAEDMTEAKANTVEVRTGELQLKPVEIDTKDVQVHLRAIKAAIEKKDTAVSILRNAKKRAKEVHPELANAIDRVLKIERADSMHELRAELEVLNIVLRVQQAPIQIYLSDSLMGDVAEQAFRRGVKDAKAEKMSSSPYPDGSDVDGHYKRGWESVMASRVTGGADLLGPEDKWPENGTTKLRQEAAAAL